MPSLTHSPFAIQKPPAGSQIDWGHPLTDRLVLSWDNLCPTGSVIMDSAQRYWGTMTGPASVPGDRFGMPWKFNGTTTQIITGVVATDIGRSGTQNFSHEGWFALTTAPADHGMITTIWNSGAHSTADKCLGVDSTGKVCFYVFSGGANHTVGTSTVTGGAWHHAVGTYDGVNIRVYVDGVLETTKAAGSTFAETAPNLVTGLSGVFGGGWTDRISSVRVWSRALNAAEIWQLYSEPFAMLRGGAGNSFPGPRFWAEGSGGGSTFLENASLRKHSYQLESPADGIQRAGGRRN